MKHLPSTYIKFWWSKQLIDTNTKIGALTLIFVSIAYANKFLKKLYEIKRTTIPHETKKDATTSKHRRIKNN